MTPRCSVRPRITPSRSFGVEQCSDRSAGELRAGHHVAFGQRERGAPLRVTGKILHQREREALMELGPALLAPPQLELARLSELLVTAFERLPELGDAVALARADAQDRGCGGPAQQPERRLE